MDLTSRRAEYDTQGFLLVRSFLSPEEFQSLRSELDRYIQTVVPTLPDGDAFYDDKSRPETLKQLQRIEQDPFFAAYREHPVWRQAAETLLGEPARCQGIEWFNKPPGTVHITPPHQDNYYFCLRPAQVLTMWLALDVVDEENGCLRYLPGSHLFPHRPHQRTKTLGFSQGISDYGVEDYAREVAIPMQPGDVVIHHGDTVHRADANRSPVRNRRSIALVFRGESCRRDETAFSRYSAAAKAQHTELGLKT